ncbi:Uncharacterised protein [Chryseobacterium nakagawai]|uniref:Lipocalin-like domain-containing protein n=1 Tax=Chryseobacterium nakagawai TaxID=1241982 RepID=A0AAD1DRX6_CHRNA|nr:hypothetical protein [Chryseobacterium nakagawai]AZA92298.1 hypothetical protein EG343_17610 [Chryseobacterium nakagawai]VEH18855.1 Uncharacterised protein [Chryseobacterium nakagawai]
MKKIILSALLLTFGSFYAQKTKSKPQTNKIDKHLVGIWKGGEKDQQIAGMEKLWVMDRKENGTFVLIFTTVQDCEVNQHIEKGQWWIENGEFHELHFASGQTDTYTYKVLDPNHVKFSSKQQTMTMATDTYSFVDTKIDEDNQ